MKKPPRGGRDVRRSLDGARAHSSPRRRLILHQPEPVADQHPERHGEVDGGEGAHSASSSLAIRVRPSTASTASGSSWITAAMWSGSAGSPMTISA